jgi:transposase
MLVERIAKRTLSLKSFRVCRVEEGADNLEIHIVANRRSLPVCGCCGRKRPVRDTLRSRRWRHVNLWGIETFIVYSPRRVKCPACGIRVERIPWSMGKSRLSLPVISVLQTLARHISWEGVARLYGVCWNTVRAAVKASVEYGLANRRIEGVLYIGIDEIARRKGHRYVTNIYDLTDKRLLATAPGRDEISLHKCFQELGKSLMDKPLVVCCDIWKPYLKIIRENLHPDTVVVFDRFHIVRNLLAAVDEVRREEYHEKKKMNPGLLKRTRYLWLKNPENLKPAEKQRLSKLEKLNLKVNRAYLLKESLRELWEYKNKKQAERFLKKWFWWATHSQIKQMRNFAWSMKRNREGILSWFDTPVSNAAVERMNGKAKAVMRRAYGIRTFDTLRLALLHNLGNLPEPIWTTHKFL